MYMTLLHIDSKGRPFKVDKNVFSSHKGQRRKQDYELEGNFLFIKLFIYV